MLLAFAVGDLAVIEDCIGNLELIVDERLPGGGFKLLMYPWVLPEYNPLAIGSYSHCSLNFSNFLRVSF